MFFIWREKLLGAIMLFHLRYSANHVDVKWRAQPLGEYWSLVVLYSKLFKSCRALLRWLRIVVLISHVLLVIFV